ncbi:hypothetical protein D3C80_2081060 [compost metagenome]
MRLLAAEVQSPEQCTQFDTAQVVEAQGVGEDRCGGQGFQAHLYLGARLVCWRQNILILDRKALPA